MFNSKGGTQTESAANRRVKFSVEALGSDGTVLGTATSKELRLTGNNTTEASKEVKLAFPTALENVAKLRITATRGQTANKGCFYGLKQLHVAAPLPLDAVIAPPESAPARPRPLSRYGRHLR